jgi:hypothetical protein
VHGELIDVHLHSKFLPDTVSILGEHSHNSDSIA